MTSRERAAGQRVSHRTAAQVPGLLSACYPDLVTSRGADSHFAALGSRILTDIRPDPSAPLRLAVSG